MVLGELVGITLVLVERIETRKGEMANLALDVFNVYGSSLSFI